MVQFDKIKDLEDNVELSPKQVASLLDCHLDTIYKRMRRREISYSDINRVIILGKDVKDYIARKQHRAVRVW